MAPEHDATWSSGILDVGAHSYRISRLGAVAEAGLGDPARLPHSIRVLLENLLRCEDGGSVTRDDIAAVAGWTGIDGTRGEIAFRPARVVLQDFTGVPALVDLAAMRDAISELGGDPSRINPLRPADLVVDHSVQVDHFGTKEALARNAEIEFERNRERFEFLRWGQELGRIKGVDLNRLVAGRVGVLDRLQVGCDPHRLGHTHSRTATT